MSFLSSLSSLSVCLIFVSIQGFYSTSLPLTHLCRCILLHSTLHAWPRVIFTKIEKRNLTVPLQSLCPNRATWQLPSNMTSNWWHEHEKSTKSSSWITAISYHSSPTTSSSSLFLLSFFFYLLTANLPLPFAPLPFLLPIKDQSHLTTWALTASSGL